MTPFPTSDSSPPPIAGDPAPGDAPAADRHFAAYVVERSDPTPVTGVRELSLDDLAAGDVLLRVDWSAINYKDGMVTQPGNRVARISPLVPGVDLVGTVVASDVYEVGASVIVHGYDLGVARHGGFAQMARVPAEWIVPLPSGLTPRRAAAIGTAGFTAALSLHRLERHGLAPGQGPVLVTGASGGVGSMAVALLAAAGYEVVASTGKADEHGYLRGLGAADVIGRDELVAGGERVLGPERWAGAIDCVGGSTLSAVLRTLRYGAAVAASGLTGGTSVETTVYPFIVRNAALLGIDSVLTPIDERRAVWDRMVDLYPAEAVDGMVADEIDLGGLDAALAATAAGAARGRVLVRPNP